MSSLQSGLPEFIDDDEDLARFLTQSGHYKTSLAKPAAFLPDPQSRETSISRHGTAPLTTLWQLGRAAAGSRNLHGAAIFKARAVREATLEAFADEPPDRHAAIRHWPWIENDPDLQKAKQKELAILLVQAAGVPVFC